MTHSAITARGMTAIEVLAATVLASLMLASVAGLTGALARQQRVLRDNGDVPSWHQQLAEQLLWDLQNSRRFIASRQGVRLEGFAGRDFATGQGTGRSAVVEYYLVETTHNCCLVRRETHPEERTSTARRMELVCSGVERLAWGSIVVDQPAAAVVGPTFRGESISLPERVPVQLYAPASATPFFDKLFHIL
jgi:Tfp pilus assembly protein PilV